MILSHVFLLILFNIWLYFYTVRYKLGIKIPDFLQNISKKNSKKSQFFKISFLFKYKKIFYFYAYGQILKFSKYIFLKR